VVNGVYDFRFRLYNEASSGNQVGPTVWREDVVVVDGLFTLELDFGEEAFDGHARWLQIGVRPGTETGSPTILDPRQALTAVPLALTLRPGATISGTLPDESILRLKNNIGDALQIDRGFYGLFVQSAAEAAIHIASSDKVGIQVKNTVLDGIKINNPGSNGVTVWQAGGNGLGVYSPTGSGVTVSSSGGSGVQVYSSAGPAYYAYNAGESGLYVYSANEDGVGVGTAGDDGFYVNQAADNGLYVYDANNDGVYINNADDDGMQVTAAGDDGYYVGSPGGDGLYVGYAGSDGIDVWAANYAGYFLGDIFVSGGCVGCLMVMFGTNSSDRELLPGDVVSLHNLQANPYSGLAILPDVGLAQNGQAILGVVQGTAVVEKVDEPRPDEPAERLVPREGAAAPGAFVTIVTHGPIQVNVPAASQPIASGARLTIGDNGVLRALAQTEVNGIRLEEDLPVLGTALEALPAGQAGVIWVLVNPH
jgi:hypothetical protein